MISYVRGEVVAVGGDHVVLDLHGLGVLVRCAPSTVQRTRLGQTVAMPSVLVVREDAWTIVGFADVDERAIFEVLQGVSGVGMRMSLALLGTLGAGGLRRAIATEDLNALMQVPGIGRKSAQRLALELRDKLGSAASTASTAGGGAGLVGADDSDAVVVSAGWSEQLRSALQSLGWSAVDADRGAAAVAGQAVAMQDADGEPDVAALLRSALQSLDRRG